MGVLFCFCQPFLVNHIAGKYNNLNVPRIFSIKIFSPSLAVAGVSRLGCRVRDNRIPEDHPTTSFSG